MNARTDPFILDDRDPCIAFGRFSLSLSPSALSTSWGLCVTDVTGTAACRVHGPA